MVVCKKLAASPDNLAPIYGFKVTPDKDGILWIDDPRSNHNGGTRLKKSYL
jgi:hypothetical protein